MIRAMKIYSGLSVLLLTLVCIGVLEGGSKARRGTAGAQELLIPVGSRGTAMAGAYVAGITGVEAAEWNVAGIAGIAQNGEALLSLNNWIGDIGVNYGIVAAAVGRNYFGLSLKSLDFGDIPVTTASQPDGTGEIYSPSYITIGFIYSRKMTDRIQFGADIKLVNESIMRERASGLSLDAGVQYRTAMNGLQIGAAIRNLGMNMLFNGSDLEEFHPPQDTSPGTPAEPRRVVIQPFELPTTFELGTAYGPIDFGVAKVTLAGSFLNNNFSFDEYRTGAEVTIMDMFFLRAGMAIGFDPEPYGTDGIEDTSDDSNDATYESRSEEFIWGPSFGFGLNLSKILGIGISVDYAFRSVAYFDGVQWVSLKIAF